MPQSFPPPRSRAALNALKARVEEGLPNEQEIIPGPRGARFETVDNRAVRFRWDSDPQAEAYEAQWTRAPDFDKQAPEGRRVPQATTTVTILLTDKEIESCAAVLHCRVRSIRKEEISPWSDVATFVTPRPGALTLFEALHTIDGPANENPIINININLPRTASIQGNTIEDLEAQWTDHVELWGDSWSALASDLADTDTEMVVTTGHGVRFKVGAEYMLNKGNANQEIVRVTAIVDDTLTIDRGLWGGTAQDHSTSDEIKWFARIIREQFIARDGAIGVTVTLYNDHLIRTQQFTARARNRCGRAGAESVATADLDLPADILDLAADPQFQKVVLTWSEKLPSAYRYEIYHATTGAVQIDDADPTTTGDTTLLAKPLADHEGVAQFIHNVVYDATVVHYYGVRAIDILGGVGAGDTVGPLQPDQFATQAAPDVTDISATEGPTMRPEGVGPRARAQRQSSVTCGFDPPDSGADPNEVFARCKIYLQSTGVLTTLNGGINSSVTTIAVAAGDLPILGWFEFYKIDSEVIKVTDFDWSALTATIVRGQEGTTPASHSNGANITASIQPIFTGAEGPTAPLKFVWPPINEVTLYFVSVSKDGVENNVLSSPNLTVTLDAQVSAPLEVQNLRGIKTIHGGRIFWDEGLEPDLSHYEIADLGSRTLVAQGDIEEQHVIASIEAKPGSGKKVFYDWVETLYRGTISAGALTIVLFGDELREDVFDPIGSPPVKETVRFVTSTDTDVTDTDYEIDDTNKTGTPPNEVSTIVLASIPAEASSSTTVEFYIGGRRHKFYVRAVNHSDLKSEWRPVESTFLELAATAPDGTQDEGVPTAYTDNTIALGGCYWLPGWAADILSLINKSQPGKVLVGAWARSADTGEDQSSDFDAAPKKNINGITTVEIEITHSDDGSTNLSTSVFQFTVKPPEKSDFFHISPTVGFDFWTVYLGQFEMDLPSQGIPRTTGVRVRLKNYFGWSQYVAARSAIGSTPISFTGAAPLQTIVEEDVTGSNEVYPNLAKSSSKRVQGLSADATVKQPEYRGDTETPGTSSEKARGGEEFKIIFRQPASPTTLRAIAFDSNYIGLEGKPPIMVHDWYTAWTFEAVDATTFVCTGYVTGQWPN